VGHSQSHTLSLQTKSILDLVLSAWRKVKRIEQRLVEMATSAPLIYWYDESQWPSLVGSNPTALTF
jgi:hypothetical protein